MDVFYDMRKLIFTIATAALGMFEPEFALSQSYKFRHYEVEDGLPSSEVYHSVQDNQGYIWFSTDKGISRFDGKNFNTYTTNEGLSDNTVFQLIKDSKGRLWGNTWNDRLFYVKEDSIVEVLINDKIDKIRKLSARDIFKRGYVSSLMVDINDTIWIGRLDNLNIYKIHPNFRDIELVTSPLDSTIRDQVIYETSTGELVVSLNWVVTDERIYEKNYLKIISNDLIVNDLALDKSSEDYTDYARACKLWDGYLAVIFDQRLLLFKNNSLVDVYETAVRGIYVYPDQQNNIWLGTVKQGVFRYTIENEKLTLQEKFLTDYSVSSIMQDRESGYWFTTLTDGVFYLPSKQIKSLTSQLPDNKVLAILTTPDGNCYAGTYKGHFVKINADQNSIEHLLKLDEEIMGLIMNPDGNIQISQHNNSLVFNPNSGKYQASDKIILQYGIIDSQSYYMCNRDHLSLHKNGVESQISVGMRVKALCQMEPATAHFLVGAKDGLYELKNKELSYLGDKIPLFKERVTGIVKDNKGRVWIATRGAGLLLWHKDKLKQFTINDGLETNICGMLLLHEEELWMASNAGVTKINLASSDSNKLDIIHASIADGLVSNEVNKITIHNNTMWIATNNGISYFDKNSISKNQHSLPVYIENFNVLGEDLPLKDTFGLRYNQDVVSLKYTGVSFKTSGKITYGYRLIGLDTNWIQTTNNEQRFVNLAPGKYTFEVKARNDDGIWSAQPDRISFSIKPPIWKNPFVLTTGMIIMLLSIFWFFRRRIYQLKEKNRIEQRLASLERTALQNQMNPHFIFNALNSIQAFVSQEDTKNAERFLASFARLIRYVLNNSKHNYVPVKDEINMLEQYLKLEKMRFKDKISYQIEVQNDVINSDVQIPPMIIQPFVENAIIHGLAHSSKKGEVKLELSMNKSVILCTIIDNGIGRKKSEALNSMILTHKSIGISASKERLELLNIDNKNLKYISIFDLEDEVGNATGTRVELAIPYSTN